MEMSVSNSLENRQIYNKDALIWSRCYFV